MDKKGEFMLNKKKIIIMLVLAVLLIAVFFLFIYEKRCFDNTCFEERIVKCRRTSFINDKLDMVLQYNIIGVKGGKCKVNVKVLEVKKGANDIAVLKGKTMTCLTSLGVISYPEEDISKCSGELKENIQDLIINRMYVYVLESMGKINEELGKVI